MKKLQLNKQAIARLDEPSKIYGGEAYGYKTTVVQKWGIMECVTHTGNYCGINTENTNCSCHCTAPYQSLGADQ
ncbi:MAG: hypothetical protein FWC34_02430 [Bacteroidetes bacterium]|nr:hypothetical protein [Bacteroidota bacterium]MCL2303535.1 hypothetical protein [Lentimicrobiaceae bacterium]